MMSDNRTETHHNLTKNTQKGLHSSYDLYSKKLQMGLSTPIEVSETSEASDVSEATQEEAESGLDFLLWHFEGQHSLFPRNIATGATNGGQKTVYDRDRAILYIQGALRQDCYLSVYPNYEELLKNDSITPDYLPKPDHVFIDLDAKQFGNDINKLNQGLKLTLKNIHQLLNGAVPSIFSSGGGYHIHQPLDANALPVFEHMPDFKRFKDITTEFMRYAERRLTNYKSDTCHKIAWKSCLARIPNTVNMKYPAKVRIIQRWNGVTAIPTKQFMLTDFLVYLIEKNFDFSAKARQKKALLQQRYGFEHNNGYHSWIEKVLQTPFEDFRKLIVRQILAPYLVTIRQMSKTEAYRMIMHWALQCSSLSQLRPSVNSFSDKVRYSLDYTQRKEMKPLGWTKLVNEYPEVHKVLNLSGGA
jgi:hypothetical protein